MSKGLVLFHQGYTDILNCLGLIRFYAERYTEIVVFIRPDMKDCLTFFCKNARNVKIEGDIQIQDGITPVKLLNYPDFTYLFHGQWDQLRSDKYQNSFLQNYTPFISERNNFVNYFYSIYDIPSYNRFLSFTFTRDEQLESSFYTKHNPTNQPYVLVHEDADRNICCLNYPKDLPIIQLNKLSNLFFDAIKLLENANGIYCIDSVWSAFLYCIDMKYMYFCNRGIPIIIKCNRGYAFMYEPHLPNWTIQST